MTRRGRLSGLRARKGNLLKSRLAGLSVVIALTVPAVTRAGVLECRVARRVTADGTDSEENLKKYKPSVLVEETVTGATLSRCGYSDIEGRDTCDAYVVDRIAFDKNVHIKKFYVFNSQFDVQVFADMTFVENNGRGSIAFGTCKAKSP